MLEIGIPKNRGRWTQSKQAFDQEWKYINKSCEAALHSMVEPRLHNADSPGSIEVLHLDLSRWPWKLTSHILVRCFLFV
jgi:hypothetical protein